MVQIPPLSRATKAILVALLTVALLVLFLRNSDLRRVGALIRSTNVGWLAVALLCNFTALVCRAERWRTILNPSSRPPFYTTFFSTALGFMASAVLPIRAGDVIRPALLSRRTGIRFSTALGTVLTERVLDLISILSLFSLFVLSTILAPGRMALGRVLFIKSIGFVAMSILVVMVCFVVSLYFFHGFVRKMHSALGKLLPERVRSGWMAFFDSFVASLSIARNRGALARVLLLTATIWTCLTSQFFFVMLALRHPLPFMASFFVTGMVILGFAIPTPGGVGGFHKVCQIVLTSFYQLDLDVSVAVALVFHAVGTAPVILTGMYLLVHEGLTLRQLARIGENPEE